MRLCDAVTMVLKEELGYSAGVFLQRCTKKSLGKSPDLLTLDDLPALADACAGAIGQTLGKEVAGRVRERILSLR
ncbi:hypothetical protein [uncultured Methanofollis sp.]|uniref:hypothetical protein n=1 Tax=uncultured Methanofollis sp. TaxID=262500 RepID=UPI0026300250|nr:hypothetical protein [uncultured Methanofollis sp.]